jgi:hypothetical protein
MTSSARHSMSSIASRALLCQSSHLIRSSAAALASTVTASAHAPLHLSQCSQPQMLPVLHALGVRHDVLLQTT